MKKTFEKLSKIKSEVCATIILNTHKTAPDNKQDAILLKNLIDTAKNRLANEYGEAVSKEYTEKFNRLAASIDHNHNDHGLMLFVNDEIEEFLRIPTNPAPRVILDDTFATRSIVRAIKKDTDYYVLVLSRGKARLIEASSENAIQEITTNGFPVEDTSLLKVSNEEGSNSQRVSNLTQEFFNRIDKAVNVVRQTNALPVVVYSEDINYHQYLKVADHPNTIIGHVKLKNRDEKIGNLVKEVWPKVRDLTVNRNRERITELEKALNSGDILTDLNEIWTAVKERRGRTIFVEERYYQPVKNENGTLTPIQPEEISSKEDINDIVDDIIEHTLQFGGDVVFLEKDTIEKFNRMALVVRY